MPESTYARAFSVLRYRDKSSLKGPPVLNSYSTPFSFSRFPASPHQSSNRPPSVQFDPLDPSFSAIMTAYNSPLRIAPCLKFDSLSFSARGSFPAEFPFNGAHTSDCGRDPRNERGGIAEWPIFYNPIKINRLP